MPTDLDLAVELARGTHGIARKVIEPVENAYGRGYVAVVGDGRAAIRKNTQSADPTPGFDVPAWLDLKVGDFVLFRENGSDRVVIAPLDRNASRDLFANPLTTAGQIIMAGPDGTPTVIEPPADPTLNYSLQWDSATQQPVWVEV